jgi:hypothetical protein
MQNSRILATSIAALFASALLSSCANFQESDSDKAFYLIQSACRIEKDSSSGLFASSVAGYTSTTWDPVNISKSELNEKFDYYSQNSQNALQASLLDSKWSSISQALEKTTQFISYVKRAHDNDDLSNLSWTENDFNVPNGVYKRNCEAIASLMNE